MSFENEHDHLTPAKKRVKLNIVTPPSSQQGASLSEDEVRDLLIKEANFDLNDLQGKTLKRTDGVLSWDDYFMSVVLLSSLRSKDPVRPEGACIVSQDKRILGIGYNGFPRHCSDDVLPWNENNNDGNESTEKSDVLHTRDPYMCHAEVNAILNKCSANVKGASLYVHHFPGNECAKVIIQSNIASVVYIHDYKHDEDEYRASRILFSLAGVELRQYKPSQNVTLDFVEAMAPTTTVEESSSNTPTETERGTSIQQEQAKYKNLLETEAGISNITSTKRTDYLSWDDYFMSMAFLTAQRSKDPNTQVGACIVNPQKRIVGLGYNGFPRQCCDDHLPWDRCNADPKHNKYLYVCHAEVNAILNKCGSVENGTLYVAMFPCNNCAKMIIQSGIKEVVYMSDPYHSTAQCRASRILLQMAGVKWRRHVPTKQVIHLDFK